MFSTLLPLPTSPADRRLQPGVAICTERPAWLLPRLADVQIRTRHLAIQADAAGRAVLPEARSPVVLDTVGLEPLRLVELLLDLLRRPQVTVALVSDTARAAAHLVQLCPAVVLVLDTTGVVQDTALFARLRDPFWALARLEPYTARMTQHWLDPHPQPIFANVLILRVLTALAHTRTLGETARVCAMSRATLKRYLQQARVEVSLPPASQLRLAPPRLATRLLQALEHVAPMRTLSAPVPGGTQTERGRR
jgi:hypothetical protein